MKKFRNCSRYIIFSLLSIASFKSFSQLNTNEKFLFETCKVWGYMKYHSPLLTNPDIELIALLNQTKSLKTFVNENIKKDYEKKPLNVLSGSFCKISNNWISSCKLIDSETIENMKVIENESNTSILPRNQLAAKRLIKNGYYNEIKYVPDSLSNSLKIIGLFKLWNHLNYFYPYRCEIKDFDSVLITAIRLIANKEDGNYSTAIRFIIGSLKDPHTVAYYSTPKPKTLIYENISIVLPVIINIQNKNIGVIVRNLKELPFKPNDLILKINNEHFTKYTFNPTSLKSYDTVLQRNVINCTGLDLINVEILRSGRKISYSIDKSKFITLKQWFDICFEKNDSISVQSPNVYYINGTAKINKKQFKNIKKQAVIHDTIILDLRGYPQSNYSNQIVSLFYPIKNNITRGFIYPDFQMPGSFTINYVEDNGDGITPSKLYVLINNFTQSWSETLALSLMENSNVEFIGQSSANGLGEVNLTLHLPGGIEFTTTDIGQIPSNNKTLYPNGIAPDIRIDFINTSDELKKILYNRFIPKTQ